MGPFGVKRYLAINFELASSSKFPAYVESTSVSFAPVLIMKFPRLVARKSAIVWGRASVFLARRLNGRPLKAFSPSLVPRSSGPSEAETFPDLNAHSIVEEKARLPFERTVRTVRYV